MKEKNLLCKETNSGTSAWETKVGTYIRTLLTQISPNEKDWHGVGFSVVGLMNGIKFIQTNLD